MTENRTRRVVARQIRERLTAERDEARADLAGTKVAYESVRADRDEALALLREVRLFVDPMGFEDDTTWLRRMLLARIDALLARMQVINLPTQGTP